MIFQGTIRILSKHQNMTGSWVFIMNPWPAHSFVYWVLCQPLSDSQWFLACWLMITPCTTVISMHIQGNSFLDDPTCFSSATTIYRCRCLLLASTLGHYVLTYICFSLSLFFSFFFPVPLKMLFADLYVSSQIPCLPRLPSYTLTVSSLPTPFTEFLSGCSVVMWLSL